METTRPRTDSAQVTRRILPVVLSLTLSAWYSQLGAPSGRKARVAVPRQIRSTATHHDRSDGYRDVVREEDFVRLANELRELAFEASLVNDATRRGLISASEALALTSDLYEKYIGNSARGRELRGEGPS